MARNFAAGPPPVTENLEELIRAVWERFEAIEADPELTFDETHVAPTSPNVGLVLLADGTNWDPGSGRGLYRWTGSAWETL